MTCLIAIATLLPFGQWLLYPLESRLPGPTALPATIDGAIVLGSGFNSRITNLPEHIELTDAGDRVTTLIRIGRRYPTAVLVYSGGSGCLLGKSAVEATQARAFYRQLGFNPEKIIFEDTSRNTWENARNSKH